MELGETLEEAFRREIREETGLEIVEPRLMMVQEAINHPEFFRPAHFVLINYVADVTGEKPAVTLNDEAEEFAWKPLDLALVDMKDVNLPTQALLKKIENDLKSGVRVWAR